VDIGVGAMVIGNITIADDCVIGAGAVVTKSCLEPGTILVGVPAVPLKQKEV
jgi:serine O-acetyltransferase